MRNLTKGKVVAEAREVAFMSAAAALAWALIFACATEPVIRKLLTR